MIQYKRVFDPSPYNLLTTIPLLLLSTTLFLFFPSVKFGITCSSSFLGSGSQFWIPLLIRHIQNLSLLFNFKIHLILQLQNQLSLVRFQNFFIQASYTIRIKTYFKVEGRKHLVWAQMNSSYRSYRHLLKKRYFEPYDNPEIARANIPLEMEKEDWDYLVNLWIDEAGSQQNKMSGAANSIIHTTGAKGAQQRAEEAFEQTGQEIDRLRLWELTHTRVNGQACNEETQEKLDLLKELSSQVNEGILEMNEHEVMVEVFGPERHGRVRGYGAGVTPTQLWGPRSFIFSDLQIKLQCAEKNMKTLK
ncbi:hypothetical protein Ahy_A03g014819 [Arachis hypogaea]|uniref:Uncharacterized protein n=2 Tax=Arachis hypogaea TaxID=3818 RepID=A0A445DYT0_ARAHY|nr:hypothetical protein Ahy_A03g014819 [Arachis hypogaea]